MAANTQGGETAELYFRTPGSGSRKAVSYRRFDSVEQAAFFVMNDVAARDRITCLLEYGEQRFGYREIKKLHEDLTGEQEIGEPT